MRSEKPGPEAIDRLSAFLESPDRPQDVLTYHELQGFLFAIVCSPEKVSTEEWMPLIFADREANYRDPEEADAITGTILALHEECNRQLLDGCPALPADCAPLSPPMDNFLDDAPLRQWANGFLIGHAYLEEVWDGLIQDEWSDELGSCLMVLSFFANKKLAGAYVEEALEGDYSIETLAERMLQVFDDAMESYAHMGRVLYIALLETEPEEKARLVMEYMGQGECCPCGSGKPYAQCCGMPKTIH